MGAWFCTREDVQSALDVRATSLSATQIDRQIEAESRGIESLLHRSIIAPTLTTKYFDWPNAMMGRSWRLWLDDNELISLTTLTSGGVAITAGQYYLEPANYGPPYDRIEINLGGPAAFSSGLSYQRAISVVGLFGITDDSSFVGTTVGSILAANNTINTVWPTVGVGAVLECEAERVICTDRAMATTGRTTTATLSASSADQTVQTDGATIHVGEIIQLDAEQMFVTGLSGNNLFVRRAWAGTALATHTTGAISALRSFTVQRGALGTSAATHADGTTWTKWEVPGLVRELCIGEVLNTFAQETSGYARTVGSGESVREATGGGLDDLRKRTLARYGRQGRQRAAGAR